MRSLRGVQFHRIGHCLITRVSSACRDHYDPGRAWLRGRDEDGSWCYVPPFDSECSPAHRFSGCEARRKDSRATRMLKLSQGQESQAIVSRRNTSCRHAAPRSGSSISYLVSGCERCRIHSSQPPKIPSEGAVSNSNHSAVVGPIGPPTSSTEVGVMERIPTVTAPIAALFCIATPAFSASGKGSGSRVSGPYVTTATEATTTTIATKTPVTPENAMSRRPNSDDTRAIEGRRYASAVT